MGLFGDAQDVFNIQISLDRLFAFTDEIAFIRLETVQREAVFIGINAHRAYAQFTGRAHDADGDFTTVGNQQATDFLHGLVQWGQWAQEGVLWITKTGGAHCNDSLHLINVKYPGQARYAITGRSGP